MIFMCNRSWTCFVGSSCKFESPIESRPAHYSTLSSCLSNQHLRIPTTIEHRKRWRAPQSLTLSNFEQQAIKINIHQRTTFLALQHLSPLPKPNNKQETRSSSVSLSLSSALTSLYCSHAQVRSFLPIGGAPPHRPSKQRTPGWSPRRTSRTSPFVLLVVGSDQRSSSRILSSSSQTRRTPSFFVVLPPAFTSHHQQRRRRRPPPHQRHYCGNVVGVR